MVTQSIRVQLRDQSGQILILTAVSMAVLLGIAALTLDASFMFAKRNRLHAAADAAALSTAIEVLRNSSVTQASLEAFADEQVSAHGFVSTRLGGTTSVVINRGPSTGPFAGNTKYVEAIVSEPTGTFFGQILGWVSMTPGATSVAGAGNPSACIITNDDLTIGQTTLTMGGCSVSVGGDLTGDNPNAKIVGTPTPNVGVSGTCLKSCGAMGTLTTGAPAPIDPLAGLALPTAPDPSTCNPGTAATLTEGCYSSIAETVTTLSPGIYYITGPVNIGNLSGTNVMLFLTGAGQLVANNKQTLHLTAPTSGPYTGIAIFQDPANTNNMDVKNSLTITLLGAMYMPSVDVDIKNHLAFTASSCSLILVKSLSIKNGDGTLRNNGCAAAFGGAAFLNASIAQ